MGTKSYNEDVERIVNNIEHQAAICARRRRKRVAEQRKMLRSWILSACACVPVWFLYMAGMINSWVSIPVLAVLSLYASFRFGRWVENGKAFGWK